MRKIYNAGISKGVEKSSNFGSNIEMRQSVLGVTNGRDSKEKINRRDSKDKMDRVGSNSVSMKSSSSNTISKSKVYFGISVLNVCLNGMAYVMLIVPGSRKLSQV